MAKALRRGIAHYAEGDANTSADDAAFVADRAAQFKTQQQAMPAPAPAAPSGIGQLLTGQFKAAQQNPASSPATAALGQFADYLSRSTGVDAVSRGPSMKDRLFNLFSGDQASTATIAQHDAASQVLRDPLVQQHLMNNPDELAMAQKDRLGYAAAVQTPEFRKKIEQAVAANTAAGANPKVTTDEHPRVVNAAVKTGATADQAHASLSPHKYTEDEFVNTFKGIPTATFALLFGNQLQHVRSPQEKMANELFDRLRGAHATATQKVDAMMAEDAARKEKGLNPIHSQSSWTAKSPLAIAQEQQKIAEKAILDAAAAFTGVSQKPFQVPPTQ